MRTYMRIFRPHEFTASEEYKSHDIPAPRVGDVVYLIDDPYEVAAVNYTYTDDECQIDVMTKDVPASWWDIDEAMAEYGCCKREPDDENSDESDIDNYYEFDSLMNDLMNDLKKMLERAHNNLNIELTYTRV